MLHFRHVTATATIAAAVALTGGAGTASAAVPCFKNFQGAGSGWKVQNDGSLSGSLQDNGSAGDANHGRLVVGGVAYPKLAGNLCAQSNTAMSLPARNLAGLIVSRSVSESGGKLRWLDTITNPGAAKVISVDLGLEVLPSQVIKTSESGNTSADANDHWTTHQSQTLFSTHQWGQSSATAQPSVIPEDGGPRWESDFGTMDDDATLRYSFFVGGGQTVRLLHASGTATSLVDAVASAKDSGALMAGYSKSTASGIVNFGNDPDGDGVNKFVDECPSVKGDTTANGCPQNLAPVPPADPVNPDSPDQPSGGGTPAPDGGVVPDTTGPGITISGLGSKKLKRSKLTTGKGVKASVACTEACRFTAKIVVKPRGKKEKTLQTIKLQSLAEGKRSIKLKVKAKGLKMLSKQRITLVIEATDGAGNKSAVRRNVGLR